MKKGEVTSTVAIIIISVIVLLFVGNMLRKSESGAKDTQDFAYMTALCSELCDSDNFSAREIVAVNGKCEIGLAKNFCERGCLKYADCFIIGRTGGGCTVTEYTCSVEE